MPISSFMKMLALLACYFVWEISSCTSHLMGEDIQKGSHSERNLQKILQRFPQADLNKDGKLTQDEARKFNQKRRKNRDASANRRVRPKPTHADVAYGKHEKQSFDIWLAKSKDGKPTPLAIFIHGGGFRGGDKKQGHHQPIQRYLDAGISFATMNYRLTNSGPYPMPMHDAARGLQWIRHKAQEWNIDPERIACFGGSAGAGISLWLAFHDDLADSKSKDLIARESTRIIAAAISNGQCTYDLSTFRDIFQVENLKMHEALYPFYQVKDDEEFQSERVKQLMKDASAITHLDKLDKVPVFAEYRTNGPSEITENTSPGVWVHHYRLGEYLKQKMEKLGLECHLTYGRKPVNGFHDQHEFLIQQLMGRTQGNSAQKAKP